MSHFARLQLVGRVTYYVGWLSLVCGALSHVKIGQSMFTAVDLTQRNLFELSVVCFLISIASELRAGNAEQEPAGAVKRAAA